MTANTRRGGAHMKSRLNLTGLRLDAPTVLRFHRSWKPTDNGCWRFSQARHYTSFSLFTLEGRRATVTAHRFSYLLIHGNIPSGKQIDHTCFNPWCVNPSHLEAVTPAENTRRRRPFRVDQRLR